MAKKRVMATVIEEDGQSYARTLDAIEHEGRWWLIGSRLERPGAEPQALDLLIPLDAFDHIEISDRLHDLVLGYSVPRPQLDGRAAPGRASLRDVRRMHDGSPNGPKH